MRERRVNPSPYRSCLKTIQVTRVMTVIIIEEEENVALTPLLLQINDLSEGFSGRDMPNSPSFPPEQKNSNSHSQMSRSGSRRSLTFDLSLVLSLLAYFLAFGVPQATLLKSAASACICQMRLSRMRSFCWRHPL